ncbi:RagB/SusD family nutrient uptake outer membrane protein [Pseudoflavitalea rhizosphaerae]|uniref:RagB/SusD family nutrient uptake outer membrane protein n=1 Tax=Pseudoflavitalea rhizosphaerae TaxID=1884793 RepID=UPI000F8D7B95|nr:RagB/SusD family nutrient uptake outer membrane protein [Pseudoflavitalea rhizosphaerae]
MKNDQFRLVLILFVLFLISACNKKKEFLDENPYSDLFTPKTVSELQALLDNDFYMNEVPELGTLSGDEYYLVDAFWERLTPKERNSYVWAEDIYEGLGKIPDWNLPYKQVLYANVVLDQITKGVKGTASQRDIDKLKGNALFIRGLAFYNIALLYADCFDGSNGTQLGIPIRLTPEIDQKSNRATLKESYDQILTDLVAASNLLQDSLSYQYRNRPGKAAAFAALARVYLSMLSYDKANEAADSCLKYYNKLIDFNTVDRTASLAFKPLNDETLYQAKLLSNSLVVVGVSAPGCIIDSTLYRSYDPQDLRKPIYFRINGDGLPNIKGGFSGTVFTFGGLAVDEIYLIKAECLARNNQIQEGMDYLNALLLKRYLTGTYVEKIASTKEAALKIILDERKKELIFRGVRWTDLKRLNKEGANITLKRKLKGTIHTLAPSDPKYILPIPPDVISLGGVQQNQR